MSWSQLPVVALVKMLDYLPLSDQLSARRVCKYWQLVNDYSVPRRELILFYEIYPRPVYWQHDQQEADLNNGLMVNGQFLESEFFSAYFRKIQRLMVAFPLNTPCKQLIEMIQISFADLQHLQFTSIGDWAVFRKQKVLQSELCMENLRTFYAQVVDVPLNLNCPKLSELFTLYDLTIDERTNEQTKKCLQNLKLLKVNRLAYPPGFEFSQLQVLHFWHDREIPHSTISLVDFPLLKELHCDTLDDHVIFEEILRQKERLKREHLKIYYQGFDLELRKGQTILDFYKETSFILNERSLRLAKESPSSCNFSLNRNTLELCDSTDDELADLNDNQLPSCLLRSITGIRVTELSKNFPAFFEISHKLPYIHSVTIFVEVKQTLLDRLPDVLPNLEAFRYLATSSQLISFDFVVRFKSLNFFTASNSDIFINEFRLILQNCRMLKGVIILDHVGWHCLDVELAGKMEKKIYKLNWKDVSNSPIRNLALHSLDHEQFLSYLEENGPNGFKWAQK